MKDICRFAAKPSKILARKWCQVRNRLGFIDLLA